MIGVMPNISNYNENDKLIALKLNKKYFFLSPGVFVSYYVKILLIILNRNLFKLYQVFSLSNTANLGPSISVGLSFRILNVTKFFFIFKSRFLKC